MKKGFKVTTTIIAVPILVISVYIFYLWATYISDVVISGEKYDFVIGQTKQQSYKNIATTIQKHPNLKIYIPYGPRVGDRMTIPYTEQNYDQAIKHNHWELLLEGDGKFFNIIRLSFESNALVQIYRHRQYFELP